MLEYLVKNSLFSICYNSFQIFNVENGEASSKLFEWVMSDEIHPFLDFR